jgi:hypothetical protein
MSHQHDEKRVQRELLNVPPYAKPVHQPQLLPGTPSASAYSNTEYLSIHS